MSTEGVRRKAREKAEKEYDAGWNLRPAEGVLEGVVDALRAEASALGSVEALALADARDDEGGPIRVVVGVRVDPKSGVTVAQVTARLRAALEGRGRSARAISFEALDDEVDTTMADESPNRYVIFLRKR